MKKLRTRQHVIEDLGFNHVERQVLLAGFVLRKYDSDYGIDGEIQLFSENGEIENRYILFQLKSSDRLKFAPGKNAFVFDISKRDLEFWLADARLIFLILYDAANNRAYLLDLQAYFRQNPDVLRKVNKFVRVYFPATNILEPEVFKQAHSFIKS